MAICAGVAHDLRFALRTLLRSPAFAAAAILTIALGVDVNTAVFHVIHAVLIESLPYREPQRLVHLAETHPEFPALQATAPDFYDWQRMASSFETLAAHTFQEMNKWVITGDGDPEPVQTVQASAELFPMLGIQPLAGRFYSAQEEAAKEPIVVLGESLWRRKYGADPGIVGRKIRLVTWSVTVAGVVSERQAQPRWADVWMPLTFLDPALTQTRRFHPLEVLARLKPGVTAVQAQAEMNGIAGRLARAYPETNRTVGVSVLPLDSWITAGVRPMLLIAWAAVSLVILLACANVAHLVLVRTVHRARELAVRAALGAGSARLTRLLLVENLALALAGGLLGALLAAFLLPVLARLAAGELPRLDSVSISASALWFGVGSTILCAALFALPAVMQSRRLDLQQVIRQSGGLLAPHRRSWFGGAIIAVEVALAFVVITGAGMLYRSFALLLDEPTGFDARGVLAAEVSLGFGQDGRKIFEEQVAPRVRAIPGVSTVAAVNCAPMVLHATETSRFATRFGIVGRPVDPGGYSVAQIRWGTPEYLEALRIPLRSGRLFTDADIGKPGFVINEALARRFFPAEDPVGRQILTNVGTASPQAAPILGVVGDVRDIGLDVEPAPTLYSLSVTNRMTLLIRSGTAPASLVRTVRNALRAANAEAPLGKVAPLEDVIRNSQARRQFALTLLGWFAALAALLTAIGIYGVISYSVSRRTGEFAIRFALGAERSHVRRLILRNFALPTAMGVAAGGFLAYLFARTLRALLYRISPADPVVLAISAAVIVLLVLASALHPAFRASAVSPAAIPRE